jgi:hypothetical protein
MHGVRSAIAGLLGDFLGSMILKKVGLRGSGLVSMM